MATKESRRIEVELDAELAESLDRIAQRRDVPLETVLRDAARQLVATERPVEDDPLFGIIGMGTSKLEQEKDFDPKQVRSILDLAGIGDSGLTDVSERHDHYLMEAEMDKWKRE
jgi:hypothetical protein